MKKVCCFLLSIFMIASITGCNQDKITMSYTDFINQLKNGQNEILYLIKDIDNNGIEDLIILNNTQITIYTYTNEIISVGKRDFSTGTVRFFYSDQTDFPGIFYFTASGGMNHYGYLTIKNEQLSIEELWTEDYSGISGQKNKITKISKNNNLIQESKKVCENNKELSFN